MRVPPTVHVVLRPSRLVAAALGIAATACISLVFLLPLNSWQQAGLVAGLVAWALSVFRREALHHGRHAVSEVRVASDLILVACMGDGRLIAGHVRSSTYVGAWLTSIVWRPDGGRFSQCVLVLPDMLPEDDFRRLRVMLRHARKAVADGIPASQA